MQAHEIVALEILFLLLQNATDDSVVTDPEELMAVLEKALRAYPDGVLVEEYVPGIDVTVGYIAGVG